MRAELQAATSDLERVSGVGDVPRSTRESERISLARLLIAREDHDEALQLLDSLREMAEAADRRGNVVDPHVAGVGSESQGREGVAMDVMGQALALGDPEGYVRTFVDEGPRCSSFYPRRSRRDNRAASILRTRFRHTTSESS